jgi:hypothetical protein
LTRAPNLFLDVDGLLNAFELDQGSEVEGLDDFDVHQLEFEFESGRPPPAQEQLPYLVARPRSPQMRLPAGRTSCRRTGCRDASDGR